MPGPYGLMKRRRILIAESQDFSAAAYRLLAEAGDVELADLDRAGLEARIGQAQVLWVRLRHLIDAGLLEHAPELEIIATPTTGLTHIDLEAAERRGVRVLSLRGETEFLKDVRATAEHTIALMLALLRHLPAAAAHVQAGGWDRQQFRGTEIYNKTAGVVGYGRLGRIVARYLRAFDARVLAADPNVTFVEPGVELVPLETLLRESDVITLHVNLTEQTSGFFGGREFEQMKRGSYFVNTARGELVDEDALLDALRSGRLEAAAVDVVANEHGPANRLTGVPNLLITPHIGGCTRESMQKTEEFLARKVVDQLMAELACARG
jgi:D-3-phosphoglycerate dehydrogenase / 2-oxoglutarate reductase